MKTSVEHISEVKKKITVEIEAKQVDKKLNQAYKDLAQRAKIPGFRPGKIPRRILERRFSQMVEEEVASDLVKESIPEVIEQVEMYPLSIPSVEKESVKTGQDFTFWAIMEVKPSFKVSEYKGLEVEREIVDITDEKVEEQLQEIRKNYGKLKGLEEDRGTREEDYVVVDYEAFENGEVLEGVKATNFFIRLGSNDFHPDFEKGLMGRKKGDAAALDIQFEEDHFHPKLAGKHVHFNVKINDIKFMEMPDLDDAFAENLGADFNSLEELRQKIREDLAKGEESRVDRETKKGILKQITDRVTFEVPESMVESEINITVENIKQNLIRQGSSLEKAGLVEEKMREDLREPSETKVKERFILAEIAKNESLSIDEKELNEGFEDVAVRMGQDAQVVRQYYEANNLVESFRQGLLEEKTLNFLVNNAKLLTVDADKP
jgi:trigger factor